MQGSTGRVRVCGVIGNSGLTGCALGKGIGAGAPRKCDRTHIARVAGVVYAASVPWRCLEVAIRTLPWPRSPARSGERKGNLAEMRPVNVGNVVVPCQLLVKERIVRTPQFYWIAVVSKLTQQEEFRFLRERIAQRDIVLGEELLVRIGIFELVQPQPGKEKARNESLGSIVGEHSLNLLFKNRRFDQPIALSILKE